MLSKRVSYSSNFKQKVTELAERIGNRAAAREYELNEADIHLWRKNKNELKSVNQKPNL